MRPLARLAALAALCTLAPSAAHACSMGPFWMARPQTYFLATPLADTVETGPGSVRFTRLRGDTSALAPIRGQVVRVEELGRDAPAALVEALRAKGPEVVLVPWGYGEDCRTIPWRGARWIETAETALFTAGLRDPSQWVDGRPVLDVFYGFDEPYPRARAAYMEYDGEEMMTARELFSFMHLLPTFAQGMEAPDPYPYVAPIFRWAEANPALARRFPATRALEAAYEASQPCVAPEGPSPAAGTYRVTLEVEGEPARTLFIRTSADRHAPECPDSVQPRDPGRLSPRRAASHMLTVYAGLHPDSIPTSNREAANSECAGAYRWDVWEDPASDEWPADLGMGFQGCFPDSPGLARAERDWMEMLRREEEVEYVKGVLRRLPGGGMVYEDAWRLKGRTYWRLRAERISPRVLP